MLIKKHADMNPVTGFNLRGQHSYSQKVLKDLIFSDGKLLHEKRLPFLFLNEENALTKNLSSTFLIGAGFFYSSSQERAIIDVEASKDHLLDNSLFFDQDRDIRGNANFYFDPYIYLNLNDKVELNVGSHIAVSEEFDQLSADVYNANISFKLSNLRFVLGKSSVQWNLGRINSLNLSNTSPPIWGIRVMNDEELQFSNFFKFLGPLKYETFISILDADRRIRHPIFVGYKASFAPLKHLELGMSYRVLFAGTNANDRSPLIYLGDSFSDASGLSNRNFIFDIRYQLIPKHVELYAESLGEDCCGPFPFVTSRDVQNLVGIHFYKPFGSPKVDVSAEFARTSYIAYRHGNYSSGFINKNKIMGHSIGPDGLGVHAKINYYHSPKLMCSFLGSFERSGTNNFDNVFHGNTDPNVETSEKSYLTSLNCIWNTYNFKNKNQILSLNGNISYVHIQDYNYALDRDRNDVFFGLSGKLIF